MKKCELDFAKRRAMNIFDKWLDVTGVIDKFSGYYSELEGIIDDAVECGVQQALGVNKPLESEV